MTSHPASLLFPPPVSDRAAWARAVASGAAADVLAKAEAALETDIPPYGRADWEHWWATGERLVAEANHNARRYRLIQLALAAGLTGDLRFVRGAERHLEALMAEPTWVLCAHDYDYRDHVLDPDRPAIDLFSAMNCQAIAEADAIIGEMLDGEVRARTLALAEKRGVGFFLARDDYRWETGLTSPNWAAVCAGAIAIAALLMEPDGPRLDAVLAKAERCFDSYFAIFPTDGGCLEGAGYWEKSMSYVAMLGDLIERRRPGGWSPLNDPRVIAIASFPARVALRPGLFPAFSDTGPRRSPEPALLNFLARRLDLPALDGVTPMKPAPRALTGRPTGEQVRDLFWSPQAQPEPAQLAALDVLPQSQWAVMRAPSLGLAAAIKGGCNDEPHNHNDVGSFVVMLDGRTPIAELGAPAYDRAFFQDTTRYQSLAARSAGHSVPVVDGCEQSPGEDAAAGTFTVESDGEASVVTIDLAPAYPTVSDLKALMRTLRFDRAGAGRITLTDEARFGASGRTLASALVTLDNVDTPEAGLALLSTDTGRALAIRYDAAMLDLAIVTDRAVALRDGPTDVSRLIFTSKTGSAMMRITLALEPVSNPKTLSRKTSSPTSSPTSTGDAP
jgi:hypothetical protein